jgi:hypothetical protein
VLAAIFLLIAVAALVALVFSALSAEPPEEVAQEEGSATTAPAVPSESGESPAGDQGAGGGEQEGSTDTTLIAADPDPVSASSVESSSELKSEQGLSYAPDNVTDDDLATSWQEGAEGSGEGEWIRFTFEAPATLVRMEIANGYQKDQRRYEGNARPEQVRVEYSDGSSHMVQLQDEQGFQSIPLSPKGTESLTLVVESVYRGTLWEDMAISEIRLFRAAE